MKYRLILLEHVPNTHYVWLKKGEIDFETDAPAELLLTDLKNNTFIIDNDVD